MVELGFRSMNSRVLLLARTRTSIRGDILYLSRKTSYVRSLVRTYMGDVIVYLSRKVSYGRTYVRRRMVFPYYIACTWEVLSATYRTCVRGNTLVP